MKRIAFGLFLCVVTVVLLYGQTTTDKKPAITHAEKVLMETVRQRAEGSLKESMEKTKNLMEERIPDVNIKIEIQMPVLERLEKSFSSIAQSIKSYRTYINKLKDYMGKFISLVVLFGTILLAMTALSLNNSAVSSLAGFFAGLGFMISRLFIGAISIIAIIVFILNRSNLWQDIGPLLLIGPLISLLVSGLALRFLDFNFPLWNRVYNVFILPILSGLLMYGSRLLDR